MQNLKHYVISKKKTHCTSFILTFIWEIMDFNYANQMFPFSLQYVCIYKMVDFFSLVQGFSSFPLTYKYVEAKPRTQVSL